MNPILQDVLYIITTGLAGTLVAFVCALIKKKTNEMTTNKYINEVVSEVVDVCNAVSMTYVDDLKKAGKFTKEAQDNAKKMALSLLEDMITTKSKELIDTMYGDYEVWVSTKIESVLKESKF